MRARQRSTPGYEPETDLDGSTLARRLSPRRVLQALIACITLLAALGLATAGSELTWLFHLNGEENLPTWFAAGQLFAAAVLALLIAEKHRSRALPFAWHWSILSGGLALVAIDELVEWHERIGQWVHDQYETSGLFLYGWVIPYGLAACLVALCYFRFWLHLPARVRRSFLLGSVLLVGGAIGFECFGGWWASHYGHGRGTSAIAWFEECSEKVGAAILIYALLVYLQDHLAEDPGRPRAATS